MTQDEIIAMATEAGWTGIYTQWAEPTGKPDWTPFKYSLTVPVTMEQIQRFAVLVAAKERNDCALICENMFQTRRPYQVYAEAAQECAAAIRARGTKEGV